MQAGAWRGVGCGCNLIHDFKFPFQFIEQWTQKIMRSGRVLYVSALQGPNRKLRVLT